MIANARDEARFLTSLVQGRLLPPAELAAMTTPSTANLAYGLGIGIVLTSCYIDAYQHGGASYSTTSAAIVSRDGKRVAVLNGNTSQGRSPGTRSSNAAFAAAQKLFCAA